MGFAVVLVGGDVPDHRHASGLMDAEFVVAADMGIRIARTFELPVHALVGDFDSTTRREREWARGVGAAEVPFDADKDQTDLELALRYVETDAPGSVDRIVVVGVTGGRLDHELGNWAICCRRRRLAVDIWTDRGSVSVLHGESRNAIALEGESGSLLSLIPMFGPARGVTARGVRWPLSDEDLYADATRGISNEFVGEEAFVTLTSGTLMVVEPGHNVVSGPPPG